eukprot:959004-Pleurochrysis_carterae.AAC.1
MCGALAGLQVLSVPPTKLSMVAMPRLRHRACPTRVLRLGLRRLREPDRVRCLTFRSRRGWSAVLSRASVWPGRQLVRLRYIGRG